LNRVVTLINIVLIGLILLSDVSLVMKYYQKPNAYALMSHVSSIHYYFLHQIGLQFAYVKVAISLLLIISWSHKLIYPSKVVLLKYATFFYSLLWILIGVLVLSDIVGTLQYSTSLPIDLYDFSLLVQSLTLLQLSKILSVVIILPLGLMVLPKLYNYTLTYV